MKRAFAILGVVVAPSLVVLACWAAIPLVTLVDDSPIIVIGKIERIVPGTPSTNKTIRLFDTAYVTVSKVLKNAHTNVRVQVGAQLPMPNLSLQDRNRTSADFRYKVGTEGIWFLHAAKGMFGNSHPSGRQPLEKEAEIRKLLSELPKATALIQAFAENRKVGVPSGLDPVAVVKAHLLLNGPHGIDLDAPALAGTSSNGKSVDHLVTVPLTEKGASRLYVVNFDEPYVGEMSKRKKANKIRIRSDSTEGSGRF